MRDGLETCRASHPDQTCSRPASRLELLRRRRLLLRPAVSLARRYGPRGAQPADVLCAPSAFLDVTGKPHWDLLLRLGVAEDVVAPNVAFDEADEVPPRTLHRQRSPST